jgi:hypothetical protein
MQKHFPKPVEAFGVQLPPPEEEAEVDFNCPDQMGNSLRHGDWQLFLPTHE